MAAEQISETDAHALDSVSYRYVVRSILGRGADAIVYLADDLEEGRPVVIKLLGESLGDDSDAALARFRTEVAAHRELQHKHIIRLVGDGITRDHRPYLVTEYTPGRSLAAVLSESGRLTTTRAIDVGIGIGEALAYVHGRGILHRDLKPSNILIPGWPEAPDFCNSKLLDFGVAGRLDQGHTQVGMIFGTLRYMSPEQIKGEQQTPATDVYGFGLLLFEMLVGHAPADRERDLATLMGAMLRGVAAVDLEGVELDLADLVVWCTRPEPAKRPTMSEVLHELRTSPHRSRAADTDTYTGLMEIAFELPTTAAPAPVLKPRPVPAPAQPPAQAATGSIARPAPAAPSVPSRLPPASQPQPVVLRARRPLLWIALPAATVIAAVAMLYLRASGSAPNDTTFNSLRFSGGLLLMGASIALGFWLRTWLGSRSQVKSQAYELVFGARASTDLTATIALQLDDLVSKLQTLDQRILAGTVALMLNEYGSATDTKDRQAALMNVVALSEKLAVRLSPWYERYKEIIASAVAVMGGVSGLMTALNSVLAHKH